MVGPDDHIGLAFSQSFKNVTLPNSLQPLSFGGLLDHSLSIMALLGSLQSLTFGVSVKENVALLGILQSFSFGGSFNQSFKSVASLAVCSPCASGTPSTRARKL